MPKFIRKIKVLFGKIGLIPLILGIVVTAKTLGFYLGPVDLIAYFGTGIVSLLLLYKGLKFDTLSLIFILYLPLTILLGHFNPVFKVWSRYASFVLVFICTSPLLKSKFALQFRNKLFVVMAMLCVMIALTSFFCYFLGINMMRNMITRRTIEYLSNPGGGFGGITNQSMLLGPISGVGVIVVSYYALLTKKKIIWICVAMCTGSLLFSASRSSLLATMAGELLLLMNFNHKMSKNLSRLCTLLIIIIATFPLWGSALKGIDSKNKGDIQSGINLDSRERKWQIRIEEWKENPVTGIGFVTVSDRDEYTREGIIEPGSSWLGVLSMTGIIGFIIFSIIYFRGLRKSLSVHSPWGAMLSGLLILIGVHMLAEGHVFSGGSYLCFLSWLIIGCATDTPYEKKFITRI